MKAESPDVLTQDSSPRREDRPSPWRLRVFTQEDDAGKPKIIVRRRAWTDRRDSDPTDH